MTDGYYRQAETRLFASGTYAFSLLGKSCHSLCAGPPQQSTLLVRPHCFVKLEMHSELRLQLTTGTWPCFSLERLEASLGIVPPLIRAGCGTAREYTVLANTFAACG